MGTNRSEGFGSRLRAARERRGVSLREIANRTKISVSALEALERNDFSRLPGGIFSRAFVRSYAVEVGLDPEDTIQEFLSQFPRDASVTAGHPRSEQVEDGEALDSERRMASTFLRLIAISVPLIGVLLYFTSAARRVSPPESTARSAAQAVDVQTPSVPPVANPPIATESPAPGSGAAVDASPAPVEAAAVAPAAVQPAVQPVAAPAGQLTIELVATGPCWVSATIDGSRAIDRLLQPGETKTLDVHRDAVLTAGDAAAITLKLNGVAAKPLGRPGEVVTTHLNLSNFRDYLPQP